VACFVSILSLFAIESDRLGGLAGSLIGCAMSSEDGSGLGGRAGVRVSVDGFSR